MRAVYSGQSQGKVRSADTHHVLTRAVCSGYSQDKVSSVDTHHVLTRAVQKVVGMAQGPEEFLTEDH